MFISFDINTDLAVFPAGVFWGGGRGAGIMNTKMQSLLGWVESILAGLTVCIGLSSACRGRKIGHVNVPFILPCGLS